MSKYQVKTVGSKFQVIQITAEGREDIYGIYDDAMEALCMAAGLNL